MGRRATIERQTKETDIRVEVDLDGSGQYQVETPIGFLTHMVEQLAKHGLFDVKVRALGDKAGISRFGSATLPMDEACVTCALDLSGRPYFVWAVTLPKAKIGDFDSEPAEVFFEGFARGSQCNLHMRQHAGDNLHHVIEFSFKAFARALRQATEVDPRVVGVPSTKGTLTE